MLASAPAAGLEGIASDAGGSRNVSASSRRDARLAALAAAALTGCVTHHPSDVYVAGWESNGTVQVATLWKNGSPIALSDGIHGALATAIAVSGQDVHVAGGVDGGTADVATTWRNGVAVPLTDGTVQAFAEAIAVSNGSVYVAGYEGPAARVWKDGVPTTLSTGTSGANALSIAVSGEDVYVAGYEVEGTEVSPGSFLFTQVARYWVNGVVHVLSDGTSPAVASAIAVSDGHVLVAGWTASGSKLVATLWRDGIPTYLTDGSSAPRRSRWRWASRASWWPGGRTTGTSTSPRSGRTASRRT